MYISKPPNYKGFHPAFKRYVISFRFDLNCDYLKTLSEIMILSMVNLFSLQKRREKRFELRRSVSDYSFHEEIKHSRFDDNALSKSKNHLKVPGSESLKTSNMTFGRIKSNSIAAPIVCTCFQATGSYQKESQKNMDRNIPAEKSSLILVAIVLVFLLSHSFRLALKVYEVLMPQGNTFENFKRCFSLGR